MPFEVIAYLKMGRSVSVFYLHFVVFFLIMTLNYFFLVLLIEGECNAYCAHHGG